MLHISQIVNIPKGNGGFLQSFKVLGPLENPQYHFFLAKDLDKNITKPTLVNFITLLIYKMENNFVGYRL